MADVGFDSDRHAQTSGDMEKGGQSLTDSSQAIGRLIDAQKAEYWSEEAGFQAVRSAFISYLRTEDCVVQGQQKRFEKFNGDVDSAARAFEAAEQGNADEFARILASMDPQPTGSTSSLPSQAPSQFTGGAAGQPGSAAGAATSDAGSSGSGAAGAGPSQSAPSEF